MVHLPLHWQSSALPRSTALMLLYRLALSRQWSAQIVGERAWLAGSWLEGCAEQLSRLPPLVRPLHFPV
jgi:hypothetical protein